LKELLGARADVAILDIHDLALARQRGRDIVAIAPLVQTPLAAVLAQPDVRRPRDLEGRRAGVTGLPSDDAVLDTVVRGDGGDPKRVRRVTIGFNAVSALVGGKVDAATAFWNVEGLAAQAKRPGLREFRVDDYGAPSYPELVLAVRRETLDENEGVVKALVKTLRRGYEGTVADPASAVSTMTRVVPGLQAKQLAAQLTAVSPSFMVNVPHWGDWNRTNLAAWSRWEAKVGIVRKPVDVSLAFWFGGSSDDS
jgi:putative hydroxymethylpyrimidine transport system substrate-binding protein